MKQPWLARAFSESLTLVNCGYSKRPFCSATASFAVKQVTRKNFDSVLEDLRHHVRNADFVSVDLEMTGVTSAPWRESFEFDRPDIRYLKIKDSAEKFAVIQFGVCPFRWDASKKSFVAHPHNFYVFPRKELLIDGPSHEFLCQTTSIEFLAKYQFDFNACIHEGISYLSRGQEAKALSCLNLANKDKFSDLEVHLKEGKDIPLVSMADVFFTERMKKRFSEWRDGLSRSRNGGSQFEGNTNNSQQEFETIFFKMRPALSLHGFTSHQFRLIHLVIEKHFKDLAYVCLNGEDSSKQKLVVYTDSKDDMHMLMKEVNDEFCKAEKLKIQAAVGFRHVIDLLSSEEKLIVGHNCFLDIAHIYRKFFGPLPPTFQEFATSVHKNFPCIIDTKQLLKTNSVLQYLMRKKSTSLSAVFAHLCPQITSASNNTGLPSQPNVAVEVQVDDTRSSNWNSGAKHEAGYDAFMTGCVFVQACSHLGIDFELHSSSTGLAQNEKLQKHINLLYLSWNNGTIIDLSSGESYNEKTQRSKIVFSNTILVWGLTGKVKAPQLRDTISEVFGPKSITSIYHLDETAAFIEFSREEFVSDFLVLKDTLEKNNDPISVLHPFSKFLAEGNIYAAPYEVYKEICSSSVSRILFTDQAKAVGIKWKTKVVEPKEDVELESSTKDTEVLNPISDAASKNLPGKRDDVISDSSYRHFSCDELRDAFRVAESEVPKRIITNST